MASVSSTFTAIGTSAGLFVKGGQPVRLAITGTWVGTVLVQESQYADLSYQQLDSITANTAFDYPAKPFDRTIRLVCSAFTSGTITYVISNPTGIAVRSKYLSIPIGTVAYTAGTCGTDTTPSATTGYLVEIFIPVSFVATGGAILNGSVGATDKLIYALYDTSGKLITNTAVAGTLAATANVFQQIAFTQPVTLAPGRYIFMLQLNGTTTRFQTIPTATFIDVLAGSVTTVFGTIPATIAFPETFTADKGPVCYLYT